MRVDRRRPGVDPGLAVVAVLRATGPMTRAALGAVTGLSRTTMSGLLMDLRRRGLVDDVRDAAALPTGGRPASLVALTATAGLAVGVDIGRTHVGVVVADGGHQVLAREQVRLDVDGHAADTLDLAAAQVERQLAACGGRTGRVIGIGLGVPAPLDAEGRVGASNILPGWVGLSPAVELERRLAAPVRVENDANLGVLAEAVWGAGRGSRLVVYIKAASGIGAGFAVDGRIFRGASGTAGEIGHTTVNDGGPLCRCGNRGCLEMLAGGPALLAQLAHSGVQVSSVADLVARAQAGDPGCVRVLADAGDWLGMASANLVNLINPDVLIFGGELGLAEELVLTTLRARVQRASLPPSGAAVRIVPAELGDRAEALGGALLVLREAGRFGSDRAEAVLAG